MKVGILGSGDVGNALAQGFSKYGYDVMQGSRNPLKIQKQNRITVGTFEETAKYGDLIVCAVKGIAAESVIESCAPFLKNKTVFDTTNPIADSEPEDGVLKFFTSLDESLMERLQKAAPDAHFVKIFNSVGSALMVNPEFQNAKPTMFVCGNNAQAKSKSREILAQFGWEFEDLGTAVAARAIEPLCMLWCIPGFLRNDWHHAFKFLRE